MKASLICAAALPLLFEPAVSEFSFALASPTQPTVESPMAIVEVEDEGADEEGIEMEEPVLTTTSKKGRNLKKYMKPAGIAAAVSVALLVAGLYFLKRQPAEAVPEPVKAVVKSTEEVAAEKLTPVQKNILQKYGLHVLGAAVTAVSMFAAYYYSGNIGETLSLSGNGTMNATASGTANATGASS